MEWVVQITHSSLNHQVTIGSSGSGIRVQNQSPVATTVPSRHHAQTHSALLCTQLNQAIKSEMELDYSIYLPFELANNKTKSLIDKIASYNSYTDKIMA